MNIKSPNFEDGGTIPDTFTCKGNSTNPQLYISDVPQGTKTLALILSDPDAPAETFYHWVLWDIDPATKEIKTGGVPVGSMQGKNSAGQVGYAGPCPPSGEHRYFFDLYALDDYLGLDPSRTSPTTLLSAIERHTLAQARLTGLVAAMS